MYQLKILNLMEQFGNNDGEKLYSEDMLVEWEGQEIALGQILHKLDEIEASFKSDQEIICYRESVLNK